ncbi:MAG: ABC transporter permease [Gemmatimonadota bacterium]
MRGPPALPAALLRRLLADPEYVESVLGDLEEEWHTVAYRSGLRSADAWYMRHALGVALRVAFEPGRGGVEPQPHTITMVRLMQAFLGDVRLALRSLRRAPGFTVAAVVALGLGAGAATAVFTLLDGVVLRPLPYADPDRLVRLYDSKPSEGLDRQPLSPVTFMDYRALEVFSDATAWWRPEIVLTDAVGEPVRASTVEVAENFFALLGVEPAMGRAFPMDETLHGSEQEAVISHALWQRRFGGERAVLGTTIRLNEGSYEVVGVMPPGFHFPGDTDVWQRLRWDLHDHSRNAHFMGALARLREDVSPAAANQALGTLTARLAEAYPGSNAAWSARAEPLADDMVGVFRTGLYALFGASGLLLLIACINVANLLLARGAARRGEMAVRAALGAGRARLAAQLLAESLVLGVLGTAVGFGVAVVAVRAFLAWSPVAIPRADTVAVDLGALGFAAMLAAVVTVLFGLVPALAAARTNLQGMLRQRSRSASTRDAGRGLLVVAEVALAVMLLAGAGLLVRSVARLMAEETGVHAPTALTMDVQLAGDNYPTWATAGDFYHRLLTNLRANPQVTHAGASNFLPLEVGWPIPVGVPDHGTPADGGAPRPQFHTVDGGWFEALGVPVLAGRTFDERDGADGQPVVVVNRALADRYWPGEEALGKRLGVLERGIGPLGRREAAGDEHVVVGVVADVKNVDVRAPPEPAVYFPLRQFPFLRMHLVVAGAGDPTALVAAVRAELRRLDPGLPLGEVQPLERVLGATADPPRLVMLLMGSFAVLALLLAAVGIYGILSYGVTQRRREIGIRMALGARPGDVLRLVVGQGMSLALAGVLLGAAAAAAGGRLLNSLLYDVAPGDPLTLASVMAVVMAVALLACSLPAMRAALLRPMQSLGGE